MFSTDAGGANPKLSSKASAVLHYDTDAPKKFNTMSEKNKHEMKPSTIAKKQGYDIRDNRSIVKKKGTEEESLEEKVRKKKISGLDFEDY